MLVAGTIVFLIAHYGDPAASNKPLPAMPETPPATPIDQKIDKQARQVAGKFILTAVARKNTGASWELLDPSFPGKAEFTKKTWAKGYIPVVPYKVSSIAETRFHVAERFPNELTIDVAFIPKKGSSAQAEVFKLGLHRRGTGSNQRWLVDYWNAAYTPPIRAIPDQ